MIKEFLNKYIKRNDSIISSKNIIHRMNGVVLIGTSDTEFDLKDILLTEVTKYCKSQGYNINKVVFLLCFDSDVKESKKRVKWRSESKIVIVKEKQEYIAIVFSGSYIEIE